jgi:hypothetical protein
VNRRDQLRIVVPAASPQEAAAIVAALERFRREMAPVPAPAPRPARPTAWARAALVEGTEHAPGGGVRWGQG